ncbi:MAG TPA: RND transporter, partial [Erythrobacter sp.]|nr:RND transporter [Erythrobacter sp.]
MKHPGAILPVALAMSGCAGSEPVAIAPPIAAPAVYATDLPAAGLQEEWWLGFGDPALDRLVRRGLEANLDIDAASGRLAAAAALLRAEQADRLPGFDGSAEIGTTLVGEGEDTAVAGLFALFDPDLNGRLAAEVRAAVAEYAETNYLLAEQRRLVAAAIASQYIEYRRTQTQLDLLEQSTDLQDQTLRIVTLRFEAGLAANLDVRRAAADLAQTRARRGLVEIARANALSA